MHVSPLGGVYDSGKNSQCLCNKQEFNHSPADCLLLEKCLINCPILCRPLSTMHLCVTKENSSAGLNTLQTEEDTAVIHFTFTRCWAVTSYKRRVNIFMCERLFIRRLLNVCLISMWFFFRWNWQNTLSIYVKHMVWEETRDGYWFDFIDT